MATSSQPTHDELDLSSTEQSDTDLLAETADNVAHGAHHAVPTAQLTNDNLGLNSVNKQRTIPRPRAMTCGDPASILPDNTRPASHHTPLPFGVYFRDENTETRDESAPVSCANVHHFSRIPQSIKYPTHADDVEARLPPQRQIRHSSREIEGQQLVLEADSYFQ